MARHLLIIYVCVISEDWRWSPNFFWYHLSHGTQLVDLPKSEKLRLINLILHSTTDMIRRRTGGDAFEKKLGKLKWKGFFSDKLSCSLNNDLAIDPKNLSLESYPCLFFCFSPISGRDCHTLLDVYGSILLRLCATKAFTFPNSGGLCGALAPSYCLAKVYSRDEGIQSVNSLIFPHPARLQQQLHHQLQFGKIND